MVVVDESMKWPPRGSHDDGNHVTTLATMTAKDHRFGKHGKGAKDHRFGKHGKGAEGKDGKKNVHANDGTGKVYVHAGKDGKNTGKVFVYGKDGQDAESEDDQDANAKGGKGGKDYKGGKGSQDNDGEGDQGAHGSGEDYKGYKGGDGSGEDYKGYKGGYGSHKGAKGGKGSEGYKGGKDNSCGEWYQVHGRWHRMAPYDEYEDVVRDESIPGVRCGRRLLSSLR